MIILWAALTGILVVENIVLNYNAFTFIWQTSAWVLTMTSVGIGVIIGFGLKWVLSSKKPDTDENYDF